MTTPENPAHDTGRGQALGDLLALWQGWNSHDVTDRAARRADAAGDAEQAETLRGLNQHAPSAMTALAAEHELTSLLAGWRWHTVLAAREQGATWADIADATSTASGGDPEHARAEFCERIAQARDAEARFDIPFRDADRYDTAAAPDPPDTAGSPVGERERTTMATSTPASAHENDSHDEHPHAHGDDPGVALEDTWFRTSLEHTVPLETPDRGAVIDGALEVARARFLADGQTTDPDEALALLHAGDRPDPRAGIEALTAADLLVHAEQADNRTYLAGSYGDLDDAYRDLEALEGEAWQRAETSGNEDDRALADYLGLLIEDPGVERFDEYTALHNTVHHTLGVPAAAPEDAAAEPAPALAREWGHLRGELRDELDAHLAEHGVVTIPQASPRNAAALAEQANQSGETDHATFGEWGDSPDAARWSPELLADDEGAERDGLVVGSIVLPGGLPPEDKDDENDHQDEHEDNEARRSPVEDGPSRVDAEIAQAYDRGPWTETSSGRQWGSLGAWARNTATESSAREAAGPRRPRGDDATEIARRLAEVRTQVALRDAAFTAEDVPTPRMHAEDEVGSHAAQQRDLDEHADRDGNGADGGGER